MDGAGLPHPFRSGQRLAAPRKRPRRGAAGGTCRYCDRPMQIWCKGVGTPPHDARTRQHVLPRSRGGTDAKENLRPCCWRCNHLLAQAGDFAEAAQEAGLTLPPALDRLTLPF